MSMSFSDEINQAREALIEEVARPRGIPARLNAAVAAYTVALSKVPQKCWHTQIGFLVIELGHEVEEQTTRELEDE